MRGKRARMNGAKLTDLVRVTGWIRKDVEN